LEERKIQIKSLAVVSVGDRDLIDMANAPCGDYRFGKSDVQKVNANKNGDSMIVEDVYVGPPVNADPYTTNDILPPENPPANAEAVSPVLPVAPPAPEDANPFDASKSEAENIRIALGLMPDETNKGIIEVLNRHGVNVSSSQVTRERKAMEKAAVESPEETVSE
jgi:hypothetical protein